MTFTALVVDGDPAIRQAMELLLSLEDFDVLLAEDGPTVCPGAGAASGRDHPGRDDAGDGRARGR